MLEAYFDESFQGKEDRRLATIAGYVSQADVWKNFNRDWRKKVLRPFGIKAFHMADCENGYGEFKGWPKEKRTEIVKTAMPIITAKTRFGIAVSVVVADFEHVTNHGKQTWGHPYLQSPYAFCFFAVIQGLSREMGRFILSQKPIVVFFDIKKGAAHETERHFNDFRQSPLSFNREWQQRLVRFRYADDFSTPPLQAADVLAYEGGKHTHHRLYEPTKYPVRKSLEVLRQKNNLKLTYFGRTEIMEFINRGKRVGRFR